MLTATCLTVMNNVNITTQLNDSHRMEYNEKGDKNPHICMIMVL